ncbi:hypothetical protein EDD66_1106 [Mobilisporobacter senegalensis]|uniref:Uncharacterized protein n=1 Tax=Mobilisporobacter senegalensis TaxID=1329262 RepID=A0A3N1XG16_9FIRM|nr:hypothetical protein [Mobilisporobacter senegalensis]ROR25656.1 hypothetical protein EDD66_1106 [Mobilisporobacter senegalensis]
MKKLFTFIILFILCIILPYAAYKAVTYDKCWSDFTRDIKNQYPIIKKLETSAVGPHHDIIIYTKKEIDFKGAEEIMLYFMKVIEQENLDECLMKRQKRKTNGTFLELGLIFQNSPKGENHSFVSRSNKDFQEWTYKLEYKETDIVYEVKDYIK